MALQAGSFEDNAAHPGSRHGNKAWLH